MRRELGTALRLAVLGMAFLAVSCESDADGGACLGNDAPLVVGATDGCGEGLRSTGDGSCLGDCLYGASGACTGSACDHRCNEAAGCEDAPSYSYAGDSVEGALQVHATSSLFEFISTELLGIITTVAGDSIHVDAEGYIDFCMAQTSVSGVAVCSRKQNCSVDGSESPFHDGCLIRVKPDPIQIAPVDDHRVIIHVPISDFWADLPLQYESGLIDMRCTIELRREGDGPFYVELGAGLNVNPHDGNTELYVGGDSLDYRREGLRIGGNCGGSILDRVGVIDLLLNQVTRSIGALSCRGCSSIADCGAGATGCEAGVCKDATGRLCQGIQLGGEALLDLGSVLSSIDIGAKSRLGLRAFIGSYVTTNEGGLQLGGRIGGVADPASLCVPPRPSPVQMGVENCRVGDACPALELLNERGQILNPVTNEEESFNIGAAIAMSGLNQALWAVYSSGALCLSISGETDGLEMLSTSLFSVFITSLSSLTYGVEQPLMLQLRPQYAPVVEFAYDENQGAVLVLRFPRLEIDVYTMVDERYARIFTMAADFEIPLSLQADDGQLKVAIGSLANVIHPDTVEVRNVEMVNRNQVQSLIGNLPTLIASLASVLDDDLIPPLDLPDIEGIQLRFVGPGLILVDVEEEPAAIGLFLDVMLAEGGTDAPFEASQPVIASLDVDVPDPNALRADISMRMREGKSFSYLDLMPRVVATMAVEGSDLRPEDAEFAYSINEGPWSFWQRGPVLTFDHPILASEGAFQFRVAMRAKGRADRRSSSYAEFEVIHDYSAPRVQLSADASTVVVRASDTVYGTDDLVMQYRVNSASWSEKGPVQDIDVLPWLFNGPVVVDVSVQDPSGNVRSVRRTFGAIEAPLSAQTSPTHAPQELGGCASSQQGHRLWSALVLVGGLFLLRRRRKVFSVAAVSGSVGAWAWLLVVLSQGLSACGNSHQGKGSCDPACDVASQCIDGACEAVQCYDGIDCPMGTICRHGVCASITWCSVHDDCLTGNICKNGQCIPSECTIEADCSERRCTAPEMPFCDYDDYPTVLAGECVCASEVTMGRHGGWLELLASEDESVVVALAYSEQYGDVIFSEMSADGAFDWQFIDGVPAGPTLRPPSGLRGGVTAVGDDAGRYLRATLEMREGRPIIHAAYQYRVSRAATSSLRYARGERAEGQWRWTFIDLVSEDLSGAFPEIVLYDSREGEQGIAFLFMTTDIVVPAEEGRPAQYFSTFNVAFSPSRELESAEGLRVVEIGQSENRSACGGACASGTVCARDMNVCVPLASGCVNGCESHEECVRWAPEGEASCSSVVETSTKRGGSQGTGLFARAVVDTNAVMHVAYYDQVYGNLEYLRLERRGDGLALIEPATIIDGEMAGRSTGDVGRWIDVHVDAQGVVTIFYEDVGGAALRAAHVRDDSVQITVLDTGLYINDDASVVQNNRVGTSIVALPRTDEGFDVYYQDATHGTVRHLRWLNVHEAPTIQGRSVYGSPEALDRDVVGASEPVMPAKTVEMGSVGFFTNVLALSDRRVIASKVITTGMRATDPSRMFVHAICFEP